MKLTVQKREGTGPSKLLQRFLGLLLGAGKNNWPIADRHDISNDPTNNCGRISAPVPFSFLKWRIYFHAQLDCPQSPIFSWDRRGIVRHTVNGGHLDFQMYRGGGRRGLQGFLPNRPRPLSSFDTYAKWKPVTQSPRSRPSYGKIEDCEQSNAQSLLFIRLWLCFNEEVIWSSTISNGNFCHHLRDSRIYYSL